jgi:NAD(P) transhydrogenase subunit beta
MLIGDRAAQVVVLKPSLNPGFAGIEKDLYYNLKTVMLFGGAHELVVSSITALQPLVPVGCPRASGYCRIAR